MQSFYLCILCSDVKQENNALKLSYLEYFRCVFYFEEGNLHFVEVAEDGVNAYLPSKVDEYVISFYSIKLTITLFWQSEVETFSVDL